jgi:asparagine synthase (glutamine-hydrolysing)
MCGVAGIFHYRQSDRSVSAELLIAMSRRLVHRGPDDSGIYLDQSIGLAHRRLSILELTSAGHQPMQTADGRGCVCYNGEIYNHATLRESLRDYDICFRGGSDTETLLELLIHRGVGAINQLIGIFGFAYWDAARRRLTLARDPLGVKQMYVYDDGSSVYFASEIKALLAVPHLPREVDPAAVNEYLHFHTAIFDRTFFRHVRQVRAGEYLTIDATGVRATQYWSVADFSDRQDPAERQVADLRELLGDVVRKQLMGDVPVGTFFSGGIDSTAVAAFARQAGKRPVCFGVHFSGQGVIDERPYQEAAAAALGVELHLVTLDGRTFPEDMGRLIYQQDQPVLGAAMFPMDRVSRLAARSVKVCLGGQGADEVFAGYARHVLVEPWRGAMALLPRSRTASFGSPNEPPTTPEARTGNIWKQLVDPRTLRRLGAIGPDLLNWRARYFRQFASIPEQTWKTVFAAPEFVSRRTARTIFEDTVSRSGAQTPLQKALHWEMQTYLTGLFHQDDRLSMAWSLESRVPIADPRVVSFAFRTPSSLKIRDGSSKWLLRQSLRGVIPDWVLTRRKVGFDTPADRWMRTEHREFVRDTLLSSQARGRGWWNSRAIELHLGAVSSPDWFDVTWKLLCLETWAQYVLDGREAPAAGDW